MMRALLFASLMTVSSLFAGDFNAARADIVIGIAAPLTGIYAPLGKQIETGAQQAINEINEAGGIGNEKLVLEAIDDKCKPENATAVANQLIGKGAAFVIGHVCDRPSIEAASVYTENKVIQISPASQNPAFTENRPNEKGGTYRFAARNTQQADVLIGFLSAASAKENIVILNDGSVYGKALADTVVAGLDEAGIKPVLNEGFEAGQERYRTLSSKIVDAGARFVFIGGTHADAAKIIRELDSLSDKISYVGGDGLVNAEFPNLILEENNSRPNLDGIFVSFPPDPRLLPTAKNAVVRFQKKEINPVGYTLRGYSTVKIIESAVRRAKGTKFDDLVDAMNAGKFQTPLGVINFDEKGDADLVDYIVHRWENGTVVPLK